MNIVLGLTLSIVVLWMGIHALVSVRRMNRDRVAYVVFDFRRVLLDIKPAPKAEQPRRFWIAIVVNSLFAIFALSASVIGLLVATAEVVSLLLT